MGYLALFRAYRLYVAATTVFVLVLPIILIARRVDARRLSGDGVWSKLFKFALSLSVHSGTSGRGVRRLTQDRLDDEIRGRRSK